MSYRPRPKARDSAEPGIVEALRAIGCSVVRLEDERRSGLPDLLVGYRSQNWLLEVKNPESTKSYRLKSGEVRETRRAPTALEASQEAWHRRWRGRPVHVVRTPQEAIAAVLGPTVTLTDVVRAAHSAQGDGGAA